MLADFANGLFELFGACMVYLHVRRLRRDRTVAGFSWWPSVFWNSWGVFNLFFYPANGLWWSFAGATALVGVNAWHAYLLYLYYPRAGRPHSPAGPT